MTDALFDTGEGLFEVNPSRLQCYLDCPRMYAFRYVEHRDERRTFSHTALGRSVHKALRDFYGLRPDDRTLARLLEALRRSWDASGWGSQTDEEDGQARAEAMLKTFFASGDHAKVRPLALESKFAWSDAKARILVTGRVDRLDASDDGYVVIDYKTGRYRGMNLDDSLPLSLYAIAAGGRLGQDVSRLRLHFLASGDACETTRDKARLASDWKLVVDIVDEMRGGSFPATPGPLCRWCDFLSVCPDGQAEQAPPVEAEA